MKKFVLGLAGMLIIVSACAQIFKWTDSQGVVHFSDSPHDGAQKVEIPQAQTFSPPTPVSNQSPINDEENQDKEVTYTSLEIIQPLNEDTIRNNQGQLVVSVKLVPKLSPGDNFQIIFDGSPLGEPQSNSVFELKGINRGAHTIVIEVVNSRGEVQITSEKITIFMQRPRVGMGNAGIGH